MKPAISSTTTIFSLTFYVTIWIHMISARSQPKTSEESSKITSFQQNDRCEFQPRCHCTIPTGSTTPVIACYPYPAWTPLTGAGNSIDAAELYVAGNFTQVPPRAFDGLRRVNQMDIQRSLFKGTEPMTFHPDAFLPNLPYSLVRLYIFDAGLTAIPTAIQTLSALQALSIQRAQLGVLPARAFQAADQRQYTSPRLQTLILSNTGIQSVNDQAFSGLENSLFTLDLSWNQLTSIPQPALQTLNVLQQLILNQNPLKSQDLPVAPFARMNRLRSLSLAGSRMGILPDKIFEGLDSTLQWLNLNENYLQILPKSIFLLTNLMTVNLEANQIKAIKANTFQNMRQLITLNINNNPIQTVRARSPTAYSGSLDKSQRICQLQIDKGAFQGLTSFRSFSLLETGLKTLNLNFLTGSSLQDLKIAGNSKLKEIELYTNETKDLPATLQFLNISSNPQLATLSSNIQTFFTEKSTFTLAVENNEGLTCNCELEWMNKVLSQRKDAITMKGTLCSNQRGVTLEDYLFKLNEKGCSIQQDPSNSGPSTNPTSVVSPIRVLFQSIFIVSLVYLTCNTP